VHRVLATDQGESGFSVYLIGDVICDAVYSLDFILRRTVFRDKFSVDVGALVMPEAAALASEFTHRDSRRSGKSMLRMWVMFVADAVSAFPISIVAFTAGLNNPAKLHFAKFLRILRVVEQASLIFMILERRRAMVNAGYRRTIYLWTIFFFCVHWVACGFFAVGLSQIEGSKASWLEADEVMSTAEVGRAQFTSGMDISGAYIRSIYWAIVTMVTVGLGDITPSPSSGEETAFALFAMYLGMILTCIIVGNLTNMVTNLDQDEDNFHRKMDNMNKYMAYRRISSSLQDRVRAYYSYMWKSLRGIDESLFLDQLPVSLSLLVAGLRSKDLVIRVSFLRKLRDPIINAICVKLDQVIVSPGDFVARKGQNMSGCFWLKRGEAEVLTADDKEVIQILTGRQSNYFGEDSLFFTGTYQNSVRAKSYCEFFFLDKEVFIDILSENLDEKDYEKLEASAAKSVRAAKKVKKFFGLEMSETKFKGWKAFMEPDSTFREIWNLVGMFGLAWTGFNVPYRIATETVLTKKGVDPKEYFFDWALDIFFICDMILRMRFFAYVTEGVVIRKRSRIFSNYVQNDRWISDVMVCLPIEIFALRNLSLLPWLRMAKFMRVTFLLKHYDVFVAYMAARRLTLSNAVHRILKIFLGVILSVHSVACGWILMARISRSSAALSYMELEALELNGGNPGCSVTNRDWICMDNLTWSTFDHRNPAVTYLRAVYFVLVDMTTIGYGDLVPYNKLETAYVALITFFGGLGYPAVVGAMAALMASLDTARSVFRNKFSILAQYMANKGFPRDLRTRVSRYYDYLWSRQRGVEEHTILGQLPSNLRMEVQEYINGGIMRQITFLQDADQELLRHLLSVLHPAVFLPGDVIVRSGELGQEMYLLERGATRVTSSDGKTTFAVLSPGDYFGEGSLLKLEQRAANVVAIGYCDCFVLHKDDFDQVTREFPKERDKIIKKLKETIEVMKLRNSAVFHNLSKYAKLSTMAASADQPKSSFRDEYESSSWKHPDSWKRNVWDMLILLIIVYNLFVIPFRIALIGLVPSVREGILLDYSFDGILFIDLYCRMRHFGFIKEGEVFTARADTVAHYWTRGTLRRDLISLFPLDFIVLLLLATRTSASTIELAMVLLRILKLVLTLRVPELKAKLDHIFETSVFKDFGAFYQLTMLLIAVISISHWTGCFFFATANYQRSTGEDFQECLSSFDDSTTMIDYRHSGSCPSDSFYSMEGKAVGELSCGATIPAHCQWTRTWIENQMEMGLLPKTAGSLLHQYSRAMNWALPTLVVVVIGDTVPVDVVGTVYVIVMIIIGVTINAAIIGNIANRVANVEGKLARHREKMNEFENFFHLYQVPPVLQQRTRNYLEYLADSDKGATHEQLVLEMPATLRAEVSNFLKLRFIVQAPFFEFCDIPLQKALAACLQSQVYSPNDFILFEGDAGNEMFFIEHGTVEVIVFRGHWRRGRRSSSVDENAMAGGSSHYGKKRRSRFKNPHRKSHIPAFAQDKVDNHDIIVLATIEAGASFGETSLFFNERRSTSIRAVDFTEVYSLSKTSLNEVLMRFPHHGEKMFEIVSHFRKDNLRRHNNLKKNLEKVLEGAKMLEMRKKRSFIAETMGSLLQFPGRAFTGRISIGKRGSSIKSMFSTTSSGKYKVHPGSKMVPKLTYHLMDKRDRNAMGKVLLQHHINARQVFKPNTVFVRVWNVLSLLFTIYQAVFTPYEFAFYADGLGPFINHIIPLSVWLRLGCEYAMDMFFIVDIYMRLKRFAVNQYGRIQTDPERIARHYKKSLFWFDVAASIPLDVFAWVLVVRNGSKSVTALFAARFIHLIRLVRVPHYVRLLDRYLHEVFPRINSSIVNVVFLLCLILLLNHWAACSWFIIHRYLERSVHTTWAIADGLATFYPALGVHNIYNVDLSPSFVYLRAMYFTVTTMSTVGYGDIRPYTLLETFHELVVVLVGACTFAALIGSMAVVFLYWDCKGEIAFKGRLRKLIQYMDFRELPKSLQQSIVEHFSKRWERFRGIELQDAIKELPLPLQLELAECIHKEIFTKVQGFRRCHIHVQRHLARHLKCLLMSQKDRVYKAGDIGRELYFILRGTVKKEVFEKTEEDVQSSFNQRNCADVGDRSSFIENQNSVRSPIEEEILGPGMHFGGECLYSLSGERTETVECLDDCEIYYILKEDFENVALEFPEHHDVGIFAELFRNKTMTARMNQQMQEQLAHFAGVAHSPLSKFSAMDMENAIGKVDTSDVWARAGRSLSGEETFKEERNNKFMRAATELGTKNKTPISKEDDDIKNQDDSYSMRRIAAFQMKRSQKMSRSSQRASITFEEAQDFLGFMQQQNEDGEEATQELTGQTEIKRPSSAQKREYM